MSKPTIKKVPWATLHSAAFIPGYGQIGPVLTETGSPTTKPVAGMQLKDEGVFVTLKDARSQRVSTYLFPLTSFTHLEIVEV